MAENYLKEELYDLVKTDSNIFDFIQEGALDGIWYWDLENTDNEWMSPKFWETLGYDSTNKMHLAKEWKDIIFEEDLELAKNNVEKHLKDSSFKYNQIVRYKHKDGSTVWIRCRGLAIRDNNGKPVRMLGAHTDITELKKAEEDMKVISDEYEKVFNGTQDAMFLIQIEGYNKFRYIRNNLSHQIKTKITLEMLRNKTPHDLLGNKFGEIVTQNYQKCVDSKKAISYEERLELPGGTRIWLTTLTPILNGKDNSYIVGSATDITERKKLELKLEKSAYYDKLTQIPNRRLFFNKLKEMVDNSKKTFALLFIDLDKFKEINDRYGHEAGDNVLKTVAKRLLDCIDTNDLVARIGGDEFTVILKDVNNKTDVDKIVKLMSNNLKKNIKSDGTEYCIEASIGIAMYPEDGDDYNTLIKNADTAMYDVKRNKINSYKFFK